MVLRNIDYEDVNGLNCIRTADSARLVLQIIGLHHLIKSSCFFIINIIGTAVGEKNVSSVTGMSQFLSCSVVVVVGLYHPDG